MRSWHVADRHLALGNDHAQIPQRLVIGFVPAGDEATRIGRLELRIKRTARRSVGRLAVEREQAVRLPVNDPAIGDVQPIAARRQRLDECEGDSFSRGIDSRRAEPDNAVTTGDRDIAEGQFLGVEG